MIWLDAQLSPHLAKWITEEFKMDCFSLRYLGIQHENDSVIYAKAKKEKALVISKDIDFLDLVIRFGSPPKLILLSCGNTSNANLKEVFKNKFKLALQTLETEDIVEIV